MGEWYRSGSAPKRIIEAALAKHAAQELALKALWAAVLESEDLLPHVLGALDVHRLAVPLTCRPLWYPFGKGRFVCYPGPRAWMRKVEMPT